MNILYYDWGANSNNDVYEAFNRLGISYKVFQHPIRNYEEDYDFSEYLKKC